MDVSKLRAATPSDLTSVYSSDDTTFRDARLQKSRTGEDPSYKLPRYSSREEWEARAGDLKRHILISTGLWPAPRKSPLKARVFDKIVHEDYTVQKVHFESYRGFFVTGNLYRPRGKQGIFPGILSPHGHWPRGRLENTDRGSVPARCISFAKQGYVVFSYDMVGYQDSGQISHRFANSRKRQLWGISLMGLQLWNSIRAIDFMISLPDVDSERLGCTGASGGATQTFMLAAVDDRIDVAAPVNMISAHFQGGCLCENAPLLRLDTSNVEIAALAAPRPLLMVSTTQDWTKNTPQVEYPMIRSIYRLYNAEDNLNHVQLNSPHNYNKSSREVVYRWFAQWLLGSEDSEKYREAYFEVDEEEDLRVFSEGEAPPSNIDGVALTNYLKRTSREVLAQFWPTNAGQLKEFESIYQPAMKSVLAAEIPDEIDSKIIGQSAGQGYAVTGLLISRAKRDEWIPAVFYQPAEFKKSAVLLVHSKGKAGAAVEGSIEPSGLTRRLLDEGKPVLAIDPFKIGEHTLPPSMKARNERVNFFTTFNKTDVQERVQDVVTAASFLQQKYSVNIIGIGEGGPWALLAASVLEGLESVIVDCNDVDSDDDRGMIRKLFVPGLARVGGLQTAMALVAPTRLMCFGWKQAVEKQKVEAVFDLRRAKGVSFLDVVPAEEEIVAFMQ